MIAKNTKRSQIHEERQAFLQKMGCSKHLPTAARDSKVRKQTHLMLAIQGFFQNGSVEARARTNSEGYINEAIATMSRNLSRDARRRVSFRFGGCMIYD